MSKRTAIGGPEAENTIRTRHASYTLRFQLTQTAGGKTLEWFATVIDPKTKDRWVFNYLPGLTQFLAQRIGLEAEEPEGGGRRRKGP